MEEVMSCGKQYTFILLAKWSDIMELSEAFRTNLLLNNSDHETTYAYISRLTQLWGELQPKIAGRHDIRELVDEFEKFSQYYYDPGQLSEPNKSEEIFKLHAILRKALEALKITTFEG